MAQMAFAEALREEARRAVRARVQQVVQEVHDKLTASDNLEEALHHLHAYLQAANALDTMLKKWTPSSEAAPTARRARRRRTPASTPEPQESTPTSVLAPLVAKALLATSDGSPVRPVQVVKSVYSVLSGRLLPGDLQRTPYSTVPRWEGRVRRFLVYLARYGWIKGGGRSGYRVTPEGRPYLEALRDGRVRTGRDGRLLLAASRFSLGTAPEPTREESGVSHQGVQ